MPTQEMAVQERGREVTRIEAFVDAAFAFAVTLLVISFDSIPDSVPALVEALKGVPAFAASFALLAWIWWAHAAWSRSYGLDDGRSVLLSLLLVFLVLIYVYPLRLIFGSFFEFVSGGWLDSPLRVRDPAELRGMFVAYAVAWTTLGCVVVALYRHAWRRRDALALSRQERIELRGRIAMYAMIPATGLVSLAWIGAVSLAGVPGLSSFSGFAYGLMGLTGVAATRAQRRAARELQGAPA